MLTAAELATAFIGDETGDGFITDTYFEESRNAFYIYD